MATFQTGVAQSGIAYSPFPDGNVGVRKASYSLTAALAGADIIEMIPVYAGETVIDLVLYTSDLDTNGAPAIVLDVGDGVDPDRYIDGSTKGQAGGFERLGLGFVAANVPYKYTADDTIDVLVATGPATGATSGTVTVIATIAKNI